MDIIEIAPHIRLPWSSISLSYARSGGKGGQNVNKVSTKVELSADLSGLLCAARVKTRILARLSGRMDSAGRIRVTAQESRSQWQNRQNAERKLIALIAEAAQEERERIATKATRGSKLRRVEGKRIDSRKKTMRRRPGAAEDDQ
ncbi:MAG: aminoacyl-tRNA hydrolase [Bacteroidetes bacterium]|nr:aminoacyl-tRNA hydrolase [Bacteroidota bacterium]